MLVARKKAALNKIEKEMDEEEHLSLSLTK
jgi:hypothetical protein